MFGFIKFQSARRITSEIIVALCQFVVDHDNDSRSRCLVYQSVQDDTAHFRISSFSSTSASESLRFGVQLCCSLKKNGLWPNVVRNGILRAAIVKHYFPTAVCATIRGRFWRSRCSSPELPFSLSAVISAMQWEKSRRSGVAHEKE